MKNSIFYVILFLGYSTLCLAQNQDSAVSKKDVYTMVEEMPIFGKCPESATTEERNACSTNNIMTHIANNLHYPKKARNAGISGKLMVHFIINKDGSLSDINIIRGIETCGACAEEAVRVVKLMEGWVPGKQNGENVRVQYRLPITFKLSRK